MTNPILEQVVTNSSGTGTTSVTTLTLTTTASIAPGRALFIGAMRQTSGNIAGVSSISLTGGGSTSAWTPGAHSVRASTHDLSLLCALVTTTIPAGAVFTITFVAGSQRRAAVLGVLTEVTTASPETTSGIDSGAQDSVSVGSNGSGTVETATATAANTGSDILSVFVFSEGTTTQPSTLGSDLFSVGEVVTSVGSGDRGLRMAYRIARAPVTQSATMTQNATSVWAAGVATYPITSVTAPAGTAKGTVLVGGVKKVVTSQSVIVGGVKKVVTSSSVIVGGVKKSLV